MDYTRKSATEWEWRVGEKHHAVRYFEQTQRLIWSGWMFSDSGPMFDDGVSQTVADFLSSGMAPMPAPPGLLEDLRAMLNGQEMPSRRARARAGGLLGWLRGRR